jgi:hypothetical protein
VHTTPAQAASELPAELLNNDPAGFAWGVWHDRTPKLISQVRDTHPYGPAQRRALDRLREEIASWQDAPFLSSESRFFRRLLEAVGYFAPGPWYQVDPFATLKNAELHGADAETALSAAGALAELPAVEQDRAKLMASLWGNRADLGFRIGRTGGAELPGLAGLVADDSADLLAALAAAEDIIVIADNAGLELLADLVLIDHLLAGRAGQVQLDVKPHPYYVSDATTADAVACLNRLSRTPATADTARRLYAAAADGRFTLHTHEFYCASGSYHQMPDDLANRYASASITIMKGDLNYRRLVGDRAWPPSAPFARAVAYFPGSVAALRTLKSDVLTGVTQTTIAGLGGPHGPWRTDGSHALIQVRLKPAA